jgi:hypothetical protein
VYLELLARDFGQGIVETTREAEHASSTVFLDRCRVHTRLGAKTLERRYNHLFGWVK